MRGNHRNGHNGHHQNSRPPYSGRRTSAPPATSGGNARREQQFSLADTRRAGLTLRMFLPTILIGLGTQGSRTVHRTVEMLKAELGRLPAACEYVTIDGAAPKSSMDPTRHIGLDLDGCGTLPQKGRHRFRARYKTIRHFLDTRVQRLSAHDPAVPVDHAVRDGVSFVLVGGAGGTSGGCLPEAITLVHDVARLRRIAEPRVQLQLIGAEMPLRDSRRQPIPEQHLIVRDTCANNLVRIFADMADDRVLAETRPDGSRLKMRAADRVWSVALADQSNGRHEFATCEAFTAMLARSLLLGFFTEAGRHNEDRNKDHEETGAAGRGTHGFDHERSVS